MSRLISTGLLGSMMMIVVVGCGGGGESDVVAESDGVIANGSSAEPSGSDEDMAGAAESGSGDMYSGGEENMSAGSEEDMYAGTEEDMYAGTEPEMEAGTEEDMYAGADADMYAGTEADMYAGTEPEMEAGTEEDMYAGAEAEMEAGIEEDMYAGAGAEMEAGAEGYAGGPGAVAENLPEGFEGKATLAFRQGKDRDAMQYLYAHALTSEAGADSILPTIGWVSGLREPKLAVRWGVGFVVTAPRNFNGDPKPVGSKQNLPTRGGNRTGGGDDGGYVGGVGGGEGDYGGGGGGANNSLLVKGAGDLGEKLMTGFTERVMNGDFGDVLKKANEGGASGRPRNGNGGGGGYEMESGGEGYGGPGEGGGGQPAGAASMTTVSQLKPGLSMLGIGTQKELIDRAREEGIDAVVVIDVTLRVSTKTGLVTNESTLAIVDPKTQKKLHTTKKFNNITIQMARDEGKEDGVDKEFEKLFEAIDSGLKIVELPAGLNAEVAAKRVNAISSEKYDNPLPILAEIKMYNKKGLLDETTLFAAYEKVLGVDFGRMLATGEEEDKMKVLNSWLPEEG